VAIGGGCNQRLSISRANRISMAWRIGGAGPRGLQIGETQYGLRRRLSKWLKWLGVMKLGWRRSSSGSICGWLAWRVHPWLTSGEISYFACLLLHRRPRRVASIK